MTALSFACSGRSNEWDEGRGILDALLFAFGFKLDGVNFDVVDAGGASDEVLATGISGVMRTAGRSLSGGVAKVSLGGDCSELLE